MYSLVKASSEHMSKDKQPKLSKYERARLIGARALQISMGSPFLIELNQEQLAAIAYNPIEIAKIEFERGVIPIEILRRMPHEKRIDEKDYKVSGNIARKLEMVEEPKEE